MQGDGRLVMVSNRIVRREDAGFGRLAGVLRSVLRRHGGVWFGWSGTVANAPTLALGRDWNDDFGYVAIDLDPSDYDAFYKGFPVRVLHPMLHSRLHDMQFDRNDMAAWFRANARFAAALKTQLRPGDKIWINDLHLLPVASQLRALGVHNHIGLFVHDALPSCRVLASVPHHEQVFSGLVACDLIGVQTTRNLHALSKYLIGFHAAVPGSNGTLCVDAHALQLGVFPVGVDVERMAGLAQRTDVRALIRRFRNSLGPHKLLVGIDRPDPANGLCQRLHAIDHLLQRSPQLAGTFSMLQISPPVRYDMPPCVDLDGEINRHVSHINGRYARPDWLPVRYVKKGFRQRVLAGYLRAADVGLMTPLHDGMTLIAKEYVACQDPSDPGVLVLSRFAGAADELGDAVQVNPLDVEDVAAGIRIAMRMPLDERRVRWETLASVLRRQNLVRWSNDFLQALTYPHASQGKPAMVADHMA